jgi:hypothetical protein
MREIFDVLEFLMNNRELFAPLSNEGLRYGRRSKWQGYLITIKNKVRDYQRVVQSKKKITSS